MGGVFLESSQYGLLNGSVSLGTDNYRFRHYHVAGLGRRGQPDLENPIFRARFLEMWGADAFQRRVSVSEDFAQLRCGRAF